MGPYGDRTTLSLNADGYLETVTDAAGNTQRFSYYGASGLLRSMVDARQGQHSFTFDALGRLQQDNGPEGAQQTLAVSSSGVGQRHVALTTRLDASRSYATRYDVSSQGGGLVYTTTMPWGEAAQAVQGPGTFTLASGAVTLGPDEQLLVSANGVTTRLQTQADPRFGAAVPLLRSMVTQTPMPGGTPLTSRLTMTRALEPAGPPTPQSVVVDTVRINADDTAPGFVLRFDPVARTLTQRTPLGYQSVAQLDTSGRVVSVDPPGRLVPVTFRYNAEGRLERAEHAGLGLTLSYNSQGRLAQATGDAWQRVDVATGASTAFTPVLRWEDSDSLGRSRRFVATGNEPGSPSWSLETSFDPHDNLLSLTTPASALLQWQYDPLDRATLYTEPPLAGRVFSSAAEFLADDSFSHETRPGGDSLGVSWGEDHRVTSVAFTLHAADGSTRTEQLVPSYEPASARVVSLQGPEVSVSYSRAGELLRSQDWSGAIQGHLERTFDSFQRARTVSVQGGYTARRDWDADGVLLQAGDDAVANLRLERDPDTGLPAATRLCLGTTVGTTTTCRSADLTTRYTHNDRGELAVLDVDLGGVPLFHEQLEDASSPRDGQRRITARSETGADGTVHRERYLYDGSGRLAQVERDGSITERYSYDAAGNRTSGPGVTAAQYDAQDRLLSYGDQRFAYTDSGEVLTRTVGTAVTTYRYDALGALRSVATSGGPTVEYVLDPLGRRVGRRLDGRLERGWLWDGTQVVAELDSTNTVRVTYAWGAQVGLPEFMVQGAEVYRLVGDHLGSLRRVVRLRDGAVMERHDYRPFGEPRSEVEWVSSEASYHRAVFGFAGGLWDPDTGLLRFGARDYDPRTGRWWSKDPSGVSGGVNLYEYAAGDPVNFVDPDGHNPLVGAAIWGGAALLHQLLSNAGDIHCVNWARVTVSAALGAVGELGTLPRLPARLQGPRAEVITIEEAQATERAFPGLFNYRGVYANHPAYADALTGTVVPGNIQGTITPLEHNTQMVSAQSPYTSWSHSLEAPMGFAKNHGRGGVILRVPLGSPPPGALWRWEFSDDMFYEAEILLRGFRSGATVIVL